MKKIVFVLAVALLATSCSMQKRHYMNGFYVESNQSAKKPAQVTGAKVELKQKTRTASTKQKVKENSPTVLYPVNEVVVASATHKPTDITENKQKSNTTKERTVAQAKKELEGKNILSASNKSSATASMNKNLPVATEHGADRGHQIGWLIVFAIFIPPLGVFLKNEPVDMWFWITLVLFLLAILSPVTLIYSLPALFDTAAIVIALLYVLQVI